MSEQQDVLTQGLQLLSKIKEAQTAEDGKINGNPEVEKEAENYVNEGDKKETPQFITCPCCGKPTLVKPLELKGAILDHYISCMVTGVPFLHTYPIYRGKVEVTATRLTSKQEQAVNVASNVIDALEGRLPDHLSILRSLANTVKLYCSISDIRLHAGTDKTYYPQDTIIQVCEELVSMQPKITANNIDREELVAKMTGFYNTVSSTDIISAVPAQMIASIVETHSHLYFVLMESGFDINFWNGIELA